MSDRDLGSWILPQPIEKPYVKIPRHRKTTNVPFGYKVDEEDEHLLVPIPLELDTLELAKKYLKIYTYKDLAAWLSKQTGRMIGPEVLRQRVCLELERGRRRAYYRSLAERYKKALQRAAAYEERLGKTDRTGWFEEDFYQSLSRSTDAGDN